MKRERLIEMVDLVLQCNHWKTSHRVHLDVDNNGGHEIYIYPNVGSGGTAASYFAKKTFPVLLEGGEEFGYYYDPEFKQAEAHIKRLLEEIKMP